MKVSIIIPVFNVEKYLKKCIDSVIKQSYKEIEIILVNDGSTDASGEICDEYALKDRRIIVIHKKNEGVSSARNTGLEISSGQYIMFIDSDDYIDLKMVEILLSSILKDNSDLVMCGYIIVSYGKFTKIECKEKLLKNKQLICEYIAENYLPGCVNSPCNKLYKRNLITHYFEENQFLGEDLLFNLDYLKSSNTMSCIDECLYYYRRENYESLSLRFQEDLLMTTQQLHSRLICFLKESANKEINYDAINIYLFKTTISYLVGLVNISQNSFEYKIKLIKNVCLNNGLRDTMMSINKMSKKYLFLRLLIYKQLPISIFSIVKLWGLFKKSEFKTPSF
ncbi:glycosyltransferase family 2 protein [Neobacillus piezotolerans]|uniref:glycosyltransferase family 2 protein n=1 Tax=Neobacillus piezotolerans TaxID=2259171 RepID=UPI0015F16B72|nr:glycosyltransferase family 2 protein [Neobacillus piezotolerans]